MMFTPQDVINEARYIINDFDSTATLRQSDDELLVYVNSGLKDMAVMAPGWFSTIDTLVCIPGQVEQALSYDVAIRLIDVISVQGGNFLTVFDRRMLDQFSPTWRNRTAQPARQWSPKEGDPLAFFLDRPSPAGQVLQVQYTRNPSVYALTQPITDVPESFKPALACYVVYKSEMKDDEHVLSQRALMAFEKFKTLLGMSNGPAA